MPQLGRGDGPGLPALYAAQRHRVAALVDAEVAQLARRRPELASEDLADVRATLWRIARQLFLRPLTRGRGAPALVAHLLALDDAPAAAGDTQDPSTGRQSNSVVPPPPPP